MHGFLNQAQFPVPFDLQWGPATFVLLSWQYFLSFFKIIPFVFEQKKLSLDKHKGDDDSCFRIRYILLHYTCMYAWAIPCVYVCVLRWGVERLCESKPGRRKFPSAGPITLSSGDLWHISELNVNELLCGREDLSRLLYGQTLTHAHTLTHKNRYETDKLHIINTVTNLTCSEAHRDWCEFKSIGLNQTTYRQNDLRSEWFSVCIM